jgi:hypothetical protein
MGVSTMLAIAVLLFIVLSNVGDAPTKDEEDKIDPENGKGKYR